MPDVVVVAFSNEHAILDSGEMVPITNWFIDGEECEREDAEVFVAGPIDGGGWIVVEIDDFEDATVH
ncbi:hypothetical protein ACSMXM_05525 [Pacificimonas sp. ICDLI1SI03]